jgi:predicted nucleotidyltransferase
MASPIGKTESEKCKNAIKMIRDAMKRLSYTDDGKEIQKYAEDSFAYSLNLRQKSTNKNITILVQGSYANKTNIPSESDVDVAIILESTFTSRYREGASRNDYGFSEGTFSIIELKDEVEKVLYEHFGINFVERHDKSIKVYGNTYRVDADVVPAYRYRDYYKDLYNNKDNYTGGIEIKPDSGGSIINYPEQHIKMGIEKNKATKFNFKKCVRIAKSIREDMERFGYRISDKISSFGIESLIWNVDDLAFTKYSSILRFTFDEVLTFLVNDFDNFIHYTEVNGIKPLFTDLDTLQAYQNFISEMKYFFEYSIQES